MDLLVLPKEKGGDQDPKLIHLFFTCKPVFKTLEDKHQKPFPIREEP